jgi:hypothetical protein
MQPANPAPAWGATPSGQQATQQAQQEEPVQPAPPGQQAPEPAPQEQAPKPPPTEAAVETPSEAVTPKETPAEKATPETAEVPMEETAQAVAREEQPVEQETPVPGVSYYDEPETPEEEAVSKIRQKAQEAMPDTAPSGGEEAIEAQAQLDQMFPQMKPEDILPPGMWKELQQEANRELSMGEIIAISGLAMVDPKQAQYMIQRADQEKMTAAQNIQQIMQQVSIYNREMARQKATYRTQEMQQERQRRRMEREQRQNMLLNLAKTSPGVMDYFEDVNPFQLGEKEFYDLYSKAAVEGARNMNAASLRQQIMQYGPNAVRTYSPEGARSIMRHMVDSAGYDPDSEEWAPFIEGALEGAAQRQEARQENIAFKRAQTERLKQWTENLAKEGRKLEQDLEEKYDPDKFTRYDKLLSQRDDMASREAKLTEELVRTQNAFENWKEENRWLFGIGGEPTPEANSAAMELQNRADALRSQIQQLRRNQERVQERLDRYETQEAPSAIRGAQAAAMQDLTEYLPEGFQSEYPVEQIVNMNAANLDAPELAQEKEIRDIYWNLVTWRAARRMGLGPGEIGEVATSLMDEIEGLGMRRPELTEFATQMQGATPGEASGRIQSYIRGELGGAMEPRQ